MVHYQTAAEVKGKEVAAYALCMSHKQITQSTLCKERDVPSYPTSVRIKSIAGWNGWNCLRSSTANGIEYVKKEWQKLNIRQFHPGSLSCSAEKTVEVFLYIQSGRLIPREVSTLGQKSQPFTNRFVFRTPYGVLYGVRSTVRSTEQ